MPTVILNISFVALLVITGCATISAPTWINRKGSYMRTRDALNSCIGEVGSYKIGARGEGFARNQAAAGARAQLAQKLLTKQTAAWPSVSGCESMILYISGCG